jgi:hypothetical protein
MADAATRWISPFWQSNPAPNFSRIWVLNPGAADATVTAYWFDMHGALLVSDEHEVGAGDRRIIAPQTGNGTDGWLRLVSDRPVIPWGTTSFSHTGEDWGFVNMSFHREETLNIKDFHPLPG